MGRDSPSNPEHPEYTRGLLQRAREGDRSAADELFGLHRERLRRALRPRLAPDLRPLLDEEDLLQATFEDSLAQLDRFEWRGKGAFLAWIVRIALNNLNDELRRGRLQSFRGSPQRPLDDALAGLEQGSAVETPSQAAIRGEESELLERALDQLDELSRTLIVNRKILGQDYRSLAEDLGIPESTARSKVSQAMNRMARWMQKYS